MDVSENRGTPKSSISKGFSIINNPFWGTPIFGNIHINLCLPLLLTPGWGVGRSKFFQKKSWFFEQFESDELDGFGVEIWMCWV